MIDCSLIAHALEAYDADAQESSVVKADDQRTEFLALFPREGWPTMTLDRYALGQAEHPDNFCRWLEFVVTDLGSMKGGSARKHIIYHQSATGSWWYDRGAFNSVDEAWEAVKQGFIDAITLAEGGKWGTTSRASPPFDTDQLLSTRRSRCTWRVQPVIAINSASFSVDFRTLATPQCVRS